MFIIVNSNAFRNPAEFTRYIITETYPYKKPRPGTYHDVRTVHFMGGTAGDYAHPRKFKITEY